MNQLSKRELRESKSNDAYYLLSKQWAVDEYLSKFKYPDYYAGAYLNEDGVLTVLTTVDNIPEVEKMVSDLADADDILFKKASHSYNELLKTMDLINGCIADNNVCQGNIKGAVLYDDKNKIVVRLDDCSIEKINDFKREVIDAEYIEYQKDPGMINCGELNPGRGIYGNTQLASVSTGYRAKRAGVAGIVTAGKAIGRTITAINATGTLVENGSIITTKDLIITSAASSASGTAQGGDSGGPAFTASGVTAGNVKGTTLYTYEALFIKATNINAALALSRY